MKKNCKIILSVFTSLIYLNCFGQSGKSLIPYDSIAADINQISPKDWVLKQDSVNAIHLISKDSIEICNFINAEMVMPGENVKDFVKNKIVERIRYDFKIMIIERLSDDSTKKIQAKDELINKQIYILPKKYNIEKLTHKFDDYIADNETEALNIHNYKKEKDSLNTLFQKLPDFNTRRLSIYLSNNLYWLLQICYPEVSVNVENEKKAIVDLLKRKY